MKKHGKRHMKRHLIALLAGLVGLVGLVALPAARATSTEAHVRAVGVNCVPPVVAVHTGDGLRFANQDTLQHTVSSRANDATGQPLFDTGLISPGGSVSVNGVSTLAPGQYLFYCTLHLNMNGVLLVEDQVPTPPVPAPGTGAAPAVGTVPAPTSITLANDGKSLFAASYVQGTVDQLPILPGGALGPPTTYASGFTNPLGIAFGSDGTLFVADSHPSSTPGRLTDGRVWAVPPGGGVATTKVIDGLPNGRHN